MGVVCRPARLQDLRRADALVVASINELTQRHGFGPMATSRPPNFQSFCLDDDPGGLWVAADADDILGFSWSWASGAFWFLAQLFVSPDHQGRGIGNQLLKRALQHAQISEASNKALITFSFNTVSQALYIRHGFFPKFPIYVLSAPRNLISDRMHGSLLQYISLEETAPHLHNLAEIDAHALGILRAKHHRYLLNDSQTRGFALHAGGDWVGYVYVSADGHIGPLAVSQPDVLGSAFRTALHVAAEGGSSQVSAFVPGTSDTVLTTALQHGMRIAFPMVLMSTHDPGDWTRYLPRNPGFM
jgi:GNAT superfamily N-acetyltransferase